MHICKMMEKQFSDNDCIMYKINNSQWVRRRRTESSTTHSEEEQLKEPIGNRTAAYLVVSQRAVFDFVAAMEIAHVDIVGSCAEELVVSAAILARCNHKALLRKGAEGGRGLAEGVGRGLLSLGKAYPSLNGKA